MKIFKIFILMCSVCAITSFKENSFVDERSNPLGILQEKQNQLKNLDYQFSKIEEQQELLIKKLNDKKQLRKIVREIKKQK